MRSLFFGPKVMTLRGFHCIWKKFSMPSIPYLSLSSRLIPKGEFEKKSLKRIWKEREFEKNVGHCIVKFRVYRSFLTLNRIQFLKSDKTFNFASFLSYLWKESSEHFFQHQKTREVANSGYNMQSNTNSSKPALFVVI